MAKTDEDWKTFLAATEEDDEEVETVEEDETEDLDDSEENDSEDSEENEDDSTDEEESDDDSKKAADKAKKSDDEKYQPRLKQFLNEDGSSNLKKLEDGYIESGKRAVDLDKQVKEITGTAEALRKDYGALLDAIKAKPDIAKALFGEEGAKKLATSSTSSAESQQETNPLLKHIEAQMTNASTREYDEFVKDHPESVTDPEKARLIGDFMKLHGRVYREQHNGEIPGMKASLEAAYRYYGWDIEIKKKEAVSSAVKKTAATRSSASARRPATKKEVSQGEEFFAKKLGVKLK